jgi:hypothetical protein
MELLGDMGQVEDHFDSVGDSVNLGEIGAQVLLISTKDRCTVCAKRNIGS